MYGGPTRDRRRFRDEQRKAARAHSAHIARDIGEDKTLSGAQRGNLRIGRVNWFLLAGVVALMAIFTVTLISRQTSADLPVEADCSKVTVHFDQTSYAARSQMLFRATGATGPTYRIVLTPRSGASSIRISPDFEMPGCKSHTMADRAPGTGAYTVQYQTIGADGKVEQTHDAGKLVVA